MHKIVKYNNLQMGRMINISFFTIVFSFSVMILLLCHKEKVVLKLEDCLVSVGTGLKYTLSGVVSGSFFLEEVLTSGSQAMLKQPKYFTTLP